MFGVEAQELRCELEELGTGVIGWVCPPRVNLVVELAVLGDLVEVGLSLLSGSAMSGSRYSMLNGGVKQTKLAKNFANS